MLQRRPDALATYPTGDRRDPGQPSAQFMGMISGWTMNYEGLLQAPNMLENTMVKFTAAGVTDAKCTYFFLERYMSAYAVERATLATTVTKGATFPAPLDVGVAALVKSEAATLLIKTNQPVCTGQRQRRDHMWRAVI